ncbi:phenylalanine--tRNA ligase beta subunit-related protein, partial [Staphylococcus aureus]
MLEGASFNRSQIRYTSKRLGLRTEASNRFEKGISPLMSKKAVDRAAYLIELLGVGTVVDGYYD